MKYGHAIEILRNSLEAKERCVKTAIANGGKCECSTTVESGTKEIAELKSAIKTLRSVAKAGG